jgi:hypothetical protein
MSQRMAAHFAPPRNAAIAGNPVLTTIMPANPNVTPNPTIQQIQTIQKAVKMLNNHQLLMKFATENKQVRQPSPGSFRFSGANTYSSQSQPLVSTGRRLLQRNSPKRQHGRLW